MPQELINAQQITVESVQLHHRLLVWHGTEILYTLLKLSGMGLTEIYYSGWLRLCLARG